MKTIKITIVSAAICLVAACSPSSEDQVKAVVLDSLKDPDSAKFTRYLEGPSAEGGRTACVEVNSKNEHGGYAGKGLVMLAKDADKNEGKWRITIQGEPLVTYDICEKVVSEAKAKTSAQ
jgi:hypothetical protein